MAKVWFNLNFDGVRELLQSPQAKKVCEEVGQKALDQLGDGYEMKSKVGAKRAYVKIRANTPKTYYENLKHNTILKAVKGAKLS